MRTVRQELVLHKQDVKQQYAITRLGGNTVGVSYDLVNERIYVVNFDDSTPAVIIPVNPL